jgi:hypothetical protein
MQINPEKVIQAIAALKAASDALLKSRCQMCSGHGMVGGPSYYAPDEGGEACPVCVANDYANATADSSVKCLQAAAALQASVQIAGVSHRTFHTVGDLQ